MRTVKAIRILCFLGFCSVLSPGLLGQNKSGLVPVEEWHQLDWNYETEAQRQTALRNGEFVVGNGIPNDVDVYYGGDLVPKIFITVPRLRGGIPGTLNTISHNHTTNSTTDPLLEPYPSWDWHRNSSACNKNRLVSVFRVQIDECGRLWVLDTGKIGSDQLCPAQIIAFDPSSNEVLYKYEIPSDQITANTSLVTPVIDVRDPRNGCNETYVYCADAPGFGLIVHDVQNRQSWRIQNKLFEPIPEYGTFNIAGDSFHLMDGILGMALTPYQPGTDRILYFHALASNTENYVYTSIIQNGTLFYDDSEAQPQEFVVLQNKRTSQSAAEAMDKNGIMYFGLMTETAIMCWNTQSNYDQRNMDVVARNHNTLQFPSGVKMVNNRQGTQELWVLTCRFQKIAAGTFDPTDINFRIQAASTADLLRGSKCKNLM